MSQGSSRKKKQGLSRRLKRGMMRRVAAGVGRVDFVRLLRRIADSESGRPWRERLAELPDDWSDGGELDRATVELTLEQLAAEGHAAQRDTIEELVQTVNHRYDHELFMDAAPAVVALMNGFFKQDDPANPFLSPDGRDVAHVEELKQHRRQGRGVAYLVNHSSHLDEFLAAVVLVLSGLGMPLFAAGANMMAIASIAKIFRAGSYVVQRRGANRPALATLYNYCRAMSTLGRQQAIFLEAWHGGARSRDGSLRYPRRLVTLRGALDMDNELVVQPVAVSYSIVPEDMALAARGGGMSWIRGMGLASTLARIPIHPRSWVWRSVQGLYGRAYVTLPKPLLLSELKASHAADPGGLELDEFVALTAIREIARTKKVMSSQLVARGLVRARRLAERRPGERMGLVEAVETERRRLSEYHSATFGQQPDLEDFIRDNDSEAVVADGLNTLRRRGVTLRWGRDEAGLPKVNNEAGLVFYANHGDRRIYSPTADQNLVVVGANHWGFAFTHLVGSRILEEKRYLNASLTLFDSRPEVAEEMGLTRRPPGRFSDSRLPKNAFVTSDELSAFKKASEVILVPAPADLEPRARAVLGHSEQPLKVVVATCGLEPESGRLPCQVVMDLAKEMGRGDVTVYSLVGPASEEDLVKGRGTYGLLSGDGADELADLFRWPPLEMFTSPDALGAQAAAILARLYALWGNIQARLDRAISAPATGLYAAQAAQEAARLVTALGGRAETMAAGSLAWITLLTAHGLSGPMREVAKKAATALGKKGGASQLEKLAAELEAEGGAGFMAWRDVAIAHELCQRHGLDAPILARAAETLHG